MTQTIQKKLAIQITGTIIRLSVPEYEEIGIAIPGPDRANTLCLTVRLTPGTSMESDIELEVPTQYAKQLFVGQQLTISISA